MRAQNYIFIVVFFFLNNFSFAQESEKVFGVYEPIKKGEKVYVFDETCALKAEANLSSKTLMEIPLGEALNLETDYLIKENLRVINSPFVKVRFRGKTGYVHSSSLAFEKLVYEKEETSFLFQLSSPKDTIHGITIKEVYANKTVLNEVKEPLPAESFSIYLSDNKGLTDVEKLLIIDFYAEACGMNGGIAYYSWSPSKLALIANLVALFDADVYAKEEKLIFPTDEGGKGGTVLFYSETNELVDEATEWINKTVVTRTYQWKDGALLPSFNAPAETE